MEKLVLNNITGIIVSRDAYIQDEDKRCNFITIEDNNEIILMLNLSMGQEYTLESYNEVFADDKTTQEILYEFNPDDFYSSFEIDEIVKVTNYRKGVLINNFNNQVIVKSDLLEFEDASSHKFFLDYMNNCIYCRFDYYEVDSCIKSHTVYEKNKKCEIKKREFKRFFRNLISIDISFE